MKKSMIIVAGLIISLAMEAQKIRESEVPTPVKDVFNNSYKKAKELKWEKEDANFEAEFEIDGIEQSILYDANGKIIETEIEMKVADLPAAMREYVSTNYNNEKIEEASKNTDASGTIKYQVEVKNKDLIFDFAGNFIEEGNKKDEDDKD